MFNRKAKKLTPLEREQIFRVKLSGCVCCSMLFVRSSQVIEFNHHLHAGRRMGNTVGTAECLWHHQGEPMDNFAKSDMLQMLGPSRKYQGAKGAFAARWGTDEELRAHQAKLVEKICADDF